MLQQSAEALAHSNDLLLQLRQELDPTAAPTASASTQSEPCASGPFKEGGLPSQPPQEAQPSAPCPKADPAAQPSGSILSPAGAKAALSPLRAFFRRRRTGDTHVAPPIFAGYQPGTPISRPRLCIATDGIEGIESLQTWPVMGRKAELKRLAKIMPALAHLSIDAAGPARPLADALQARFPDQVSLSTAALSPRELACRAATIHNKRGTRTP